MAHSYSIQISLIFSESEYLSIFLLTIYTSLYLYPWHIFFLGHFSFFSWICKKHFHNKDILLCLLEILHNIFFIRAIIYLLTLFVISFTMYILVFMQSKSSMLYFHDIFEEAFPAQRLEKYLSRYFSSFMFSFKFFIHLELIFV
jgi:hypothetical protein